LYHIFNANGALLQKIEKGIVLRRSEELDLKLLPATYLICYFNGFEEAKDLMETARPLLKNYDLNTYESLKESFRILRKIKYS
jgi:hypothetical protein